MKKSILALGAAVALGGFAGAAHATAYFGQGATAPAGVPVATKLEQNPGGTGHMLYMPYYSTQGPMSTLVNLVNTDTTNGKAVKVRFRGAANSDDVLDFTVLLSPGDVWTASLAKGDNGLPMLKTPDNSCTIPNIPAEGRQFDTTRLPTYAKNLEKQLAEGYVEFLNMADIPPGSGLYKAIKHNTSGTRVGFPNNCEAAAVTNLYQDLTLTNAAGAEAAGLFAPTGQLMGSWGVLNPQKLAVYGGNMTAVRAVDAAGGNAYGYINFAPQSSRPVDSGVVVKHVTADPLLHGGTVPTLWFDLPDMSTPLVGTYNNAPNLQVMAMDIAQGALLNEYVASNGGAMPIMTDWVVSQPTRRYYATVNYADEAKNAAIVFNDDMTAAAGGLAVAAAAPTNNAYKGLTRRVSADNMPYACIGSSVSTMDREEKGAAAGAEFSPGVSAVTCGEVFTLTFGSESVLNAAATNEKVSRVAGTAGWARLALSGANTKLPLVGFAATSAEVPGNGNYGQTLGHRW